MLAERFAAAATREPLNDLGDRDRAELAALLGRVDDFDELPGRWQAALLAAESDEPPKRGCGCGCHGAAA